MISQNAVFRLASVTILATFSKIPNQLHSDSELLILHPLNQHVKRGQAKTGTRGSFYIKVFQNFKNFLAKLL